MKNLRFIREDAGFTLRELAEMTWISYSLLQQIESGKRSLSPRTSEILQEVLGVTADFLADESNFGIICFSDGGQEKSEILSLAEYKTQRALGNIKINAHYSHPPYTEQEKKAIREWADETDYQAIIRKRERPFVLRTIKSPELAKSSPAIEAMKGEIGRLIVNMNEEQLAKALLVIKEVILK